MDEGLHQECVFTPLLFNFSFAAEIHEASTGLEANNDVMDALAGLRR